MRPKSRKDHSMRNSDKCFGGSLGDFGHHAEIFGKSRHHAVIYLQSGRNFQPITSKRPVIFAITPSRPIIFAITLSRLIFSSSRHHAPFSSITPSRPFFSQSRRHAQKRPTISSHHPPGASLGEGVWCLCFIDTMPWFGMT